MSRVFNDIEQIQCKEQGDTAMCTIRTTTQYGRPSKRTRISPIKRVRMEDMPDGGSGDVHFGESEFNLLPSGDYECEYDEYDRTLTCDRD